MFEKLVAIEPVSLIPSAEQALTSPPATTRSCDASGTPTLCC